MSKLFISYRRDDTADICGRLYDKLAPRFGAANVFKDVDSIPLGADFRQVLRDSVAQCAAMLVVIGRNWLTVTDAAGRRRLENPNDFVRIEVEAALARNIPVIPVLVQGAAMPREDELPPSLAPLAYRHGIDVRGDPHFHRDADQLMDRLAPLLQPAPARPVQQPAPPVAPILPPLPPEQFPPRLASLGFEARKKDGVAYIVPPLCSVPAGEFLMGSDKRQDPQAYDSELPQHRVNLPAFQLARFPVTVAEYVCFVRAGQKEPSGWQSQLGKLDHPVINVSWHDAVAYAAWLAKTTGQPWRLPTEAEWEKAARWDAARQVSRLYPWGDAFDTARCNTSEGGKGGTTPVGSYPTGASPCGAQEMAGNVWEWTSSLFKLYPYSASDGREGANSTGNRVLRGGSWYFDARLARAAYRARGRPDDFIYFRGIRLVLAASAGS